MDLVAGAQAFQILAAHLKETGEGGLRRELDNAIKKAAQPVAAQIGSLANLGEHMPDHYAAVLDQNLRVTVRTRAGSGGGITIAASAPLGGTSRGRRVGRLNEGIIGHPVFGRRSKTNPRQWANWELQADSMKPGFFTGPARAGAPRIRNAVLGAMRDTAGKITRKA
jgi:hypothetical protein